ncbi:hypothetical protein BLA29_003934 [Euroglyphus maynei]|uniref:Uncharacterized protein n=1 Tax=Euroglyphus maynei TaxID=6958 RepID=A0A1Y3BRZ9_EURMA|nr:hypothetical protein BLA29_003934 [Euroglyphus maynei]
MDHLFTDLKHTLPMILGQNNGIRLRKTHITLRLLVAAFLTGDLDEFRIIHFRMMQHKRTVLNSDEIQEKIEQFKDSIKSSCNRKYKNNDDDGEDDERKQKSYKTYLTRKTSYGGNTLHMACRKNDPDAIERYFDQTQPNQQDRYGYTPLIDCIRYEHYKCLETLINVANSTDNPLNYEIAIAKENGFTALHYAMINGNRDAIRLILENGGYHLMYIESKDGYSPETLMKYIDQQQQEQDGIKLNEFISQIECKKMSNHLPLFVELSKKFSMNIDQLLSYYCEMITILFQCYLQTIRIHQFNFTNTFMIDEQNDDEDLIQQSIRMRLSDEYQRIFQRNPNELELEMIIDDLKIIGKFPEYLQRFIDQLKLEQKLNDDYHVDIMVEFQSLQLSMKLIRTKLGDFLGRKRTIIE